MVIQQKAGPATGFVLVLSPLETTRNKVHTVSNFGLAEQGAGAEAVLCVCVCGSDRGRKLRKERDPLCLMHGQTLCRMCWFRDTALGYF